MTIRKNKKDLISQETKIDGKHDSLIDTVRHGWIQEAAYFMAESRGFAPGCEQKDWSMAEK